MIPGPVIPIPIPIPLGPIPILIPTNRALIPILIPECDSDSGIIYNSDASFVFSQCMHAYRQRGHNGLLGIVTKPCY